MRELRQLTPEAFAWLALALLKSEVSPAVRMVALAGPDGGRDAVLTGPCQTSRYRWSGYWVFQFKHYGTDASSARSRVLSDYEKGFKAVRELSAGNLSN